MGIPVYLKALGLPEDALPLLWAADFIPVSDHKSPLVIGEFNCSCLGLAGFLNVRGGDIKDIKKEDEEMGMAMANLIGEKALEALKAKKRAEPLWLDDFVVRCELRFCLGKYREFAMLGHRLALFRSIWVRRQYGDTPVGRHKMVESRRRG